MLFKSKTSSRNIRRRKSAKPTSKRLADISWQLIGMITIIVILMTLAFGESYQASSMGNDNILDQSFSELVASLESTLFKR